MKINEFANKSKVDEEWYDPRTWFKKKSKSTSAKAPAKGVKPPAVTTTDIAPAAKATKTPAVTTTKAVDTLIPKLGTGSANKAANQIKNKRDKTQKALDAFKKEMGTESDHTISSRTNYNLSDKGGKQKDNFTQHIRDYEHGKGLSTMTTAQQHDGSTSTRLITPGGSGWDVQNGVEKKIQMKGPQSWAYDKPKPKAKINASKNIKEGDMEADKKNPHAQPYLNTPEWKILHDIDDKIIGAYVKHKSIARAAGRGIQKGLKKLSKLGSKKTSYNWDGENNGYTQTTTYNEAEADDLYHDNVKKVGQKDYNDYKGIQIHNLRKELKQIRKTLLNLQDIESKDNSSDMVQDIRNMLGGYEQMIDNMESAFEKLEIGRHRTESMNEQGVIVPGVNTTIDVKPGQTEIEAAKFGNGKIKPLMPKGKSHSHILFNLGLAESVIDKKLKEADEDGNGREDLAGFDAKTTYALKALQAKYPHADNLMSAMMAQTEETNKRQDVADSLSTQQDEKHDTRFQQLEKRLVDLINKNQLKEGKKRA